MAKKPVNPPVGPRCNFCGRSAADGVLVIPTDEEAEIARDVALISAGEDISDPYKY